MKNIRKGFIVPLLLIILTLIILGIGSIYFFSDKNSGGKPSDGKDVASTSTTTTVPTSTTITTSTPSGNTIVGAGQRCGGNMSTAPVCVKGYHCAATSGSHLPFGDVGGTCVKD